MSYLCFMKRRFLFLLFFGITLTAAAQRADGPVRLAAGLSAGTTGLGVEAVALLPQDIGLRAGFNLLSVGIPFSVALPESVGGDGTPSSFKAKLNMNHGYLLADIYLVPGGRFHLTGGLWAGQPVLVRLSNTAPLPESFNSIGLDVDDYSVHAVDGNITAELRVNAWKPYVGVGFGRLQRDRRWNVSFDAGFLFWGNPGLFATGYDLLDEEKVVQLTSGTLDGMDKGLLDRLGQTLVYPLIRCNVHYHLF